MRVIELDRSMGKTTLMVEWLRGKKTRLLLVMTHDEKGRIRDKYPDVETQVYAFNEVENNPNFSSPKFTEVGVDNLDLILKERFGLPIKQVTVSKED